MARKYLIPFLLLILLNLLFGIYSGLGRMGWTDAYLPGYLHHGAIMVGGFLGTLIALEKAIPLKRWEFLLVPLTSASSIFFLWQGHSRIGITLLILAGIGLATIYIIYLLRQRDLYMWLMLVSAICLITGNVTLLHRQFYPASLPWWMAFLLFTIVSERLELSRFLPVTRTHKIWLLGFLFMFLAGVVTPFHFAGNYVAGASLVLVSLWLMRHDVVRINLRKTHLTRFSGIALLCGYAGLLLTGIFFIFLPQLAFAYDALVHTFFLGFVFMMIFAHGPIILPGVIGIAVKPYHPFLYVPLSILAVSLLVRIGADLNSIDSSYRLVSGYLTAASFFLYFGTLVTAMVKMLRHAKIL